MTPGIALTIGIMGIMAFQIWVIGVEPSAYEKEMRAQAAVGSGPLVPYEQKLVKDEKTGEWKKEAVLSDKAKQQRGGSIVVDRE